MKLRLLGELGFKTVAINKPTGSKGTPSFDKGGMGSFCYPMSNKSLRTNVTFNVNKEDSGI